ncbi:hypothetical protein C7N43_31295 [Sphingobacteriales bacterium UPWRP_1]|nr:hypothetical protein BVG80_14900 [Sphingobacteriales bacterium TSM_CSM]PSJ73004.1 hypothetical protein C7N43_31295 [Sphingobacteriales bacterium UPWRP_1]
MNNSLQYQIVTIVWSCCLLLPALFLQAQPDTSAPERNWQISGYIKDLQTNQFTINPNSLITGSLVHHRFNFTWYPATGLTFSAGLRNRLFYGEQVKYTPNFARFIDVGNSLADLSEVWLEKNTVVVHSVLDRLWAEYQTDKWSIRAGRQRINWGIHLIWNPNDVFNNYNFLDFDYEERPGSDAIRLQYFVSGFAQADVAVAPAKTWNGWTAAARYGFNQWEYDVQVLAGKYKTDVFLGAGWAGNLGNAGFKGEVSYFHPYRQITDTSGVLSASVGADYMFNKGWYINGAALLNSGGASSVNSLLQLFAFNLSPKSLMPTRYNFMFQTSKSFTPLLTGSAAVLYSPNGHLLGFLPSVSCNIALNWDADLTGQFFFADLGSNQPFKTLGNAVYLRFKWSYAK